ncbi:MAG: hypothetical protein CM1200mP41_06640 [Gammaproteobacteria bacterium]|nr:MAG: hypothetical protein CM1200mP41_06640 [Gammaproteobacteria bacterium]
MLVLRGKGGVPIASGENLHSTYEFRDLIRYGGVSFPEPDAATLGGITPWLRVARLAESHNLPVTSHGVHDLHVHLLGGIPNASYLEVHGFGLERFIESPIQISEGWARRLIELGMEWRLILMPSHRWLNECSTRKSDLHP